MATPPKSKLARLARLGGLTSRVTTSYLGERVKSAFQSKDLRERAMRRLHVENAEKIADAMSRLKGAAMKLGQGMAMAAQTLDLPEEVSGVLSKLHADAEPIPFDIIKEDVEKSLEMSLSEAYADFDSAPLGTASLAQAHVARLHDGTEVVVKVLHRGIEGSVATDLLALKALLIGSRALRRDREEIDEAFEEVRERLEEELDYLHEAMNIQAFQDLFGQDPRLRVPRLHHKYCTERVLTMDRMPGKPVDVFVQEATPEARQRAGLTLTELYYQMAFKHRTLHADPHPGNYLFEPDGRVGLLDFGCVKRFDEFWIASYCRAALAAVRGDREATLQACRDAGAWVGNDPEAADVLWRFCDTLADPMRQGVIELGGDKDDAVEKLKPVIKELLRYPQLRVPRNVIFLHRSLGGLYTIGSKLRVQVDVGKTMQQYATLAVARAEGRA